MQHEKQRKNVRKHIVLVLCCSMAIVLAGCASGLADTPSPTPTTALMAFAPLHLDLPAKAWDAPITGKVPDEQPLHVGITLKLNQQVLDQMSSQGIAQPGESVNANDIAQKLGISEADYQRLKQFFGVNGGTLQLSQTRTSMTLDMQAGKLAQLLQTSFVVHTLDTRTFYTPDPQHQPQLPAALAANILAVTGLDNYSLPPTHQVQLSPQQAQQSATNKQEMQAGANCTPPPDAWNWQQVADAYGYDQLWQKGWHGENMTINIVSFEATNLNDLRTYLTCAGFKGALDFVNVNGQAPKPTKGDGETTLDVEMIAGLAPAAHIKVYQVAWDQTTVDDFWSKMNDTLQRIADDNAAHSSNGSAVSISWGGSEEYITGEVAKAMSQRFELLTTAEHMTTYAASGDCGAYSDHVMGSLSTLYPSSDAWVASVGGTNLIPTQRGIKETGWTGAPSPQCQNHWGSGGGLSTLFKKPDWQQAPGVKNQYSNGYRQVPDVAAIAANVPMFVNGKWTVVVGTSAATPIWAAGMALVNQGLLATKGFFVYGPDTFYSAQTHAGNLKPFNDAVEGNNMYYNASPGWDYVTGLGSPSLPSFYQVVASTMAI